ncbi:MAG: response regulator [Thermoplasmata archaeon]|nr:response regulator [Thermoplasmata archaeon]MCI4332339.1 response regulator [Thermoplasmata archaeon]MCI4346882.1 response regulator [Thermoplasmata archaeon]
MTAEILIVEDNPTNLKLATVVLAAAGYSIRGAADAEEAADAIARKVPDLILMDLGLPGKDGYEFTRELRSRAETGTVPILAVTSFAMKGDRVKAMEAGCSAYVTKPIDRRALLDVVDALLHPKWGGR